MGLVEFDRIEAELKAIQQKVNMVVNQAAQHYENVEGALWTSLARKPFVTPVTALIFAAWSVVCVAFGAWVHLRTRRI